MLFHLKHRVKGKAAAPEVQGEIARVVEIWTEARTRFAHDEGPYLFGRFSVADAMFAPVACRFHTYNVKLAPAAQAWCNTILAHPEVAHDGYDEALLLDPEGYVAEGAGENIFIVKKGKLYTPDLTSCLEGITRDSVITLSRELGIDLIEKRITRDEVYTADEAFFTGTAAEVTPIRELDTRTIGSGSRGPITAKLQALFFDIVGGKNTKYADWLAHV